VIDNRPMSTTATSLYESDFYGWIQHQAAMLRARNLTGLDVDNLLEEMETMGRSEKRSLKSSLSVLLMHLLKWEHQPNYRDRSWQLTIQEQRIQVRRIIKDSPSLKYRMEEIIEDAWEEARVKAEKETRIDQNTFPDICPWSLEQMLDDAFWPGALAENGHAALKA